MVARRVGWLNLRLTCCGLVLDACTTHAASEAACVAEHRLIAGSSEAGYLGLSEAQRNATASLSFSRPDGTWLEECSGVLIDYGIVLTAAHCAQDEAEPSVTLRFGPKVVAPQWVLDADAVESHPEADLLLVRFPSSVELERYAEPIPPVAATLEMNMIGARLELGGYGTDAGGLFGERSFVVERVLALEPSYVVVDGHGVSGACLGDSGGPLLGRSADGSIRVYGVLSDGSATCRGPDRYARVDGVDSWPRENGPSLTILAQSATPDDACGDVREQGRCFGETAVWCDADQMRAEACREGQVCGWSPAARGYRCVAPEQDPCAGVTDVGECAGVAAVFCRAGRLETMDCATCGDGCDVSPTTGRAVCFAWKSDLMRQPLAVSPDAIAPLLRWPVSLAQPQSGGLGPRTTCRSAAGHRRAARLTAGITDPSGPTSQRDARHRDAHEILSPWFAAALDGRESGEVCQACATPISP